MTSLQTRIAAMRDELVHHRADGYATTTDVLLLLELIDALRSIAGYNDAPTTTKRDILDLFNKAICNRGGALNAPRRWFVPAYQADNGNVIPIGARTVRYSDAKTEAESLRSPEDEADIFVAFRDEPAWRPLKDGTCPDCLHARHDALFECRVKGCICRQRQRAVTA